MSALNNSDDMKPYKNLSGISGVSHYEIGSDFIKVKFLDKKSYLYTYASAGVKNIEHMKQLAEEGRGLSSFISTTVRNAFDTKED
jgi:hypothetical protein